MRIIVLVILSYFFAYDGFSQESAKERLEVFAKKNFKSGIIYANENIYETDTFNTLCYISNKNAIDYKTSSNVNIDDPSYVTSFVSMEILTDIFKKCMSEKLNVKVISERDNILLMMVSDLSGKITKVFFIYEYRFNIPVEAIEQIENEIKAKCRLDFDKGAKAFLHAKYVETNCTIFLKDICY